MNNWIKKIFFKEKNENSFNQIIKKNRDYFLSKINKIFLGKTKIDENILDEIEEVLISSDIGIETTLKIIKNLEKNIFENKYINNKDIYNVLSSEIMNLLKNKDIDNDVYNEINHLKRFAPNIIMVVGVNGVGKTTTIAKLAYRFKNLGFNIVIAAADTFRAAAIDQLSILSNKIDVPIIKKNINSDPASVVFETLNFAKKNKFDIVLIDTAGRLHNKINLMNQLSKIKRVMQKVVLNSPHEIILVLDGNNGQNSIEQAKQFSLINEINSIILTKLDGTAKGGVAITIHDQLKIPIKYIGIGENIQDLYLFNKIHFINSIFK